MDDTLKNGTNLDDWLAENMLSAEELAIIDAKIDTTDEDDINKWYKKI